MDGIIPSYTQYTALSDIKLHLPFPGPDIEPIEVTLQLSGVLICPNYFTNLVYVLMQNERENKCIELFTIYIVKCLIYVSCIISRCPFIM